MKATLARGIALASAVVVGAIALTGMSSGASDSAPATPSGVTVHPGVGTLSVSWKSSPGADVTYEVASSPAGLTCTTNSLSCEFADKTTPVSSFTVTASAGSAGPSSAPAVAAVRHRTLLIVAGQSNANGWQSFVTDPTTHINYMAAPDANGADSHDSLTWTPWLMHQGAGAGETSIDSPQVCDWPGLDQTSVVFGPEIGVARQLWADRHLPVTIVKAAYPGSGLATQWLPDDNNLFPQMVAKVRSVMTHDAAGGQFDTIGAFYWYQGETDAMSASTSAAYNSNLWTFIHAVRSQLPMSSSTPFAIAEEDITNYIATETQNHTFSPAQTWIETAGNAQVRAADQRIARRMSDVFLVDTAALPRTGGFIHLNNVSELSLGNDLARATESHLP